MKKPDERKQFAALLVAFAIIFGLIVRVWPEFKVGVPINDGGMFYQMTLDLIANHFRLPLMTTYNQGVFPLPYVYPPLGFYLGASLQQISGVPLYSLFRFLPGILASLCIPAVYFFSVQILKDETRAAISTILYATLPISFNLLYMGGGINRSLGMLFSILTMGFACLLFRTKKWKYVFPIAVIGSLLVLSHPESTYHTIVNVALFWIVFGRDRKTLSQSIVAAFLIISFTSPWWVFIWQNHGFTPFLTAMIDQLRDPSALFFFLQFNLSGEPMLTIVGVMASIGLVVSLKNRSFFLPAWFLLCFIVSQRALPFSAVFPFVLLSTIGIEYLLGIRAEISGLATKLQNSRTIRIVLLLLIAYNLFGGLMVGIRMANTQRILPDEINNLSWISQHTPVDSRFIILTGLNGPDDSLSEWFPALSSRPSLATIQGHEWNPQKSITPALKDYWLLQSCLAQTTDCLDQWVTKTKLNYDYVYLRKIQPGPDGNIEKTAGVLENSLRTSSDYNIAYESETAVIFSPINHIHQ